MLCFLPLSTSEVYLCSRRKKHSPVLSLRPTTSMVHGKERQEMAGDAQIRPCPSRRPYSISEPPPFDWTCKLESVEATVGCSGQVKYHVSSTSCVIRTVPPRNGLHDLSLRSHQAGDHTSQEMELCHANGISEWSRVPSITAWEFSAVALPPSTTFNFQWRIYAFQYEIQKGL